MPVELPAPPVVARTTARELSEAEVIAHASAPVTARSLVQDLRALGVEDGHTLLVHSSLSRLGWVALGAFGLLVIGLMVSWAFGFGGAGSLGG